MDNKWVSKINPIFVPDMETDLKKQTARSILWNALDKVGFQVVALVVGLITMRLLSPREFGLIGALAIFTALSNILVESGFTSAMIRRKENSDAEYGAVLSFNVLLSIIIYAILYLSSGWIADYYKMPELEALSHVLFLSFILNSFSIVPIVILTKSLSFKKMSIASLLGALVSGGVTIVLILRGYSYWALAWQIVLQSGVKALFLWIFCGWVPKQSPRFEVLKELFSFSFSLIGTNLLNTFARYIYNPFIGRGFGEERLGYYAESYKFYFLPVSIISGTFSGVALPVLSRLNEEAPRQLLYLRKMMRVVAFSIFPVMLGAMACFDNLEWVVLGQKWVEIVPYFRVLAVAGLVGPMHIMYLNLMVVKGYSKYNFYLELIRNCLTILCLFLFHDTVYEILWGVVVANFLSYVVDLFFVRRVVAYSIFHQLKDIFPYLILSLFMGGCVYMVGTITLEVHLKLLLQLVVGVATYLLPAKMLGSTVLEDVLNIFLKRKH